MMRRDHQTGTQYWCPVLLITRVHIHKYIYIYIREGKFPFPFFLSVLLLRQLFIGQFLNGVGTKTAHLGLIGGIISDRQSYRVIVFYIEGDELRFQKPFRSLTNSAAVDGSFYRRVCILYSALAREEFRAENTARGEVR